jgi:hypothetical protein
MGSSTGGFFDAHTTTRHIYGCPCICMSSAMAPSESLAAARHSALSRWRGRQIMTQQYLRILQSEDGQSQRTFASR